MGNASCTTGTECVETSAQPIREEIQLSLPERNWIIERPTYNPDLLAYIDISLSIDEALSGQGNGDGMSIDGLYTTDTDGDSLKNTSGPEFQCTDTKESLPHSF